MADASNIQDSGLLKEFFVKFFNYIIFIISVSHSHGDMAINTGDNKSLNKEDEGSIYNVPIY